MSVDSSFIYFVFLRPLLELPLRAFACLEARELLLDAGRCPDGPFLDVDDLEDVLLDAAERLVPLLAELLLRVVPRLRVDLFAALLLLLRVVPRLPVLRVLPRDVLLLPRDVPPLREVLLLRAEPLADVDPLLRVVPRLRVELFAALLLLLRVVLLLLVLLGLSIRAAAVAAPFRPAAERFAELLDIMRPLVPELLDLLVERVRLDDFVLPPERVGFEVLLFDVAFLPRAPPVYLFTVAQPMLSACSSLPPRERTLSSICSAMRFCLLL